MGRRRQKALLEFLSQYPVATSLQLATLIWAGDDRLARAHLLEFTRAGLLRRLPHPVYRNGAYCYTTSERASTHGQKVLHHLAEVDFHLAVVRSVARYGARVIPELPWGPGLVPDQTIVWRDNVWAVEHHLSGQFRHAPDYERFLEEESFEACHWWRPGVHMGLLVVTSPARVDSVRSMLSRHNLPSLTTRVTTQEIALRDLTPLLRTGARDSVSEQRTGRENAARSR